jgi:hypothetical protein
MSKTVDRAWQANGLRGRLLAWGMTPCKGDGCRKLLNPEIGFEYCTDCRRRRRQR